VDVAHDTDFTRSASSYVGPPGFPDSTTFT
jgi:hypothetical protein